MRRISFLSGGLNPSEPDTQANITAFQQGLEQLGWSVGRNVRIDYRWALGNSGNLRKYAEELAALAPDVILTSGNASMRGVVAGDAHGANRIRKCRRSCRLWFC